MLKNNLLHFISGYVRAEVKGYDTELFLDRCLQNDIPIWMVKRLNDETISCYFYLNDVTKMKVLMRRLDCKLSFKEKHGLPFIKKKLYSRKGIVLGLITSLAVMFILSNMVWSIQIHSENPEIEHEVRKTLHQMGIKRGTFILFLPNEQEIQQQLTEKMDALTWVGVQRLGTRYTFELVEKKTPDEKEALNPRHLIAKKKAIIHKVFTEQGQALVEERDYVQKGEVLISGIIGSEDNEKVVPAKGSVLGEVWYLSEVTVPLNTTFVTNTGRTMNKYALKLGKLMIPIWGFENESFVKKEILNDIKPIYFFKWQLPISFQKQQILEIEHRERKLDEQEARELALEMTEKELTQKLDNDAEIKGKKILREKVDNGKVNIMIHYQVIEEIATEKPIIRGD